MFYLSIISLIVSLLANPPQTEKTITASEAKAYVGQTVRVCGVVFSIRESRRGAGSPTFLNFDQPYSRTEFSAVIWRWQRHHFLNLRERRGQRTCVIGKVREYRGRAQMTLTKAA